jgi:TolA-binding protein
MERNHRRHGKREKLVDRKRRRRPLIEQLQERNWKLQDKITRLYQEIEINEHIIEELLHENPSEEGEDEEKHYADSVEDAESFDDITLVEIKDIPTSKKKNKKEEIQEEREKAHAWALDRKRNLKKKIRKRRYKRNGRKHVFGH